MARGLIVVGKKKPPPAAPAGGMVGQLPAAAMDGSTAAPAPADGGATPPQPGDDSPQPGDQLSGPQVGPAGPAGQTGTNVPPPPSPGTQASPEEQALYEQFVAAAFKLIYPDAKVNPQIQQRLRLRHSGTDETESQQAVDALAQTALFIFMAVKHAAESAKAVIPVDVLFHAGVAIVQDLAIIAKTKQRDPVNALAPATVIYDYTPDEIHGALYRGLDMYHQMMLKSGELTPQDSADDLQTLQKASAAGNLDEAAPGLQEAADTMGKQLGGK